MHNCGEGALRGEAGEETGDKMHNSRCREVSTGDNFHSVRFLFTNFHSAQSLLILTQTMQSSATPHFHSANYLQTISLPLFTQPISIQVEEEICEEVEVEKCQEVKDQKCQVIDEEVCETKETEKCKEVEEEVCEQVKEEKCSVEEKEVCTVKEEEQCRIETTEQCKQVQNHSKDASISVAFWYSGIVVTHGSYGIVTLYSGVGVLANSWFAKVQNTQSLIASEVDSKFDCIKG